MPKAVSSFELTLKSRSRHQTLTNWLYGELRSAILEGRLAPGARLPASRDFASQYELSRGSSRQRSGAFTVVAGVYARDSSAFRKLDFSMRSSRPAQPESAAAPPRALRLSAEHSRLFRDVPSLIALLSLAQSLRAFREEFWQRLHLRAR
jgi:DNA-binding transcriptional MocR family regulator